MALVALAGAALASVAAPIMKDLILRDARHAWPGSKPHDYEVLHEGKVVGRIVKLTHAPADRPWAWSLGAKHRGYIESREAAMAALRKAWDAEGGTGAE